MTQMLLKTTRVQVTCGFLNLNYFVCHIYVYYVTKKPPSSFRKNCSD